MDDIKIENLESKTSIFYRIRPVTKILISDPQYTKEIADRYDREGINCYIANFTYDRMRYEDEFEIEELAISLFSKHYAEKAVSMKEYELGIDSSKIEIGFNDENDTVLTGGDGGFGVVREFYTETGDLVGIRINMNVPDFRMNFEEFLEMIKTQLGIRSDIEWANQEKLEQDYEQKQI